MFNFEKYVIVSIKLSWLIHFKHMRFCNWRDVFSGNNVDAEGIFICSVYMNAAQKLRFTVIYFTNEILQKTKLVVTIDA